MKGIAIQLVDNIDDGEVLDIKITPIRDQDGKIISGLVVGNTLEQNKALILIGSQGDFKFRPDLGVSFEDILLGADLLEYRHKVTEHFRKDGLKITELDLYNTNNIKIIAVYES
jgi:hypothetical protein